MKESSFQSNTLAPLLTTSLHIPQLPEGLIIRSFLIGRMDLALKFPLTLILAPAGFGKTSVLSQWISEKKKVQDRVAWISLENECDLHRFWTYVVTALSTIESGIGESALALLESAQPPIHTILRTLINEIAEVNDDFVLILDDFHRVEEPTIHATLTFFIDHIPSNLHLMIASRSQPPLSLARWRAGNQLYELREVDLRFTVAEIARFFNESKGMNLSPEEIVALETRTEGWIAGFDYTAKHNFISAFTGSQRYILDYLVEEVLQRQPDEIKTFLLQTSMLEQLCASLCNSVTGQIDGQSILERLERAHMFTIPLDHERRWYRYHHLFRDVLRHSLQQTQSEFILELHRRAASWYARAGQTDDAIRHACAAHEWDQAIELIELAIRTAWNRGELRKILSWFGSLPDEYLNLRPELSLYYCRTLLHGGQMESAERRLREIEAFSRARMAADPSAEDRLLLGTICALRATIAAVSEEPAWALTLGEEALSLIPSEHMEIRAYGINSVGVAHYYLGSMTEAARVFAAGSELASKAGNPYVMVAGTAYQAKALVCQGQLKLARQVLEHALSQSNPSGGSAESKITAAGLACAILGNLLYEWDQLEEAERYLTEAIELGQQLAYGTALWSAYLTLMRLKLVQGDKKGAERLMEQAQWYRLTYTVLLPARLMDAEQAQANLSLGQLPAVERWASTLKSDRPASPAFVQEIENITLARLYLWKNEPEQALARLDPVRPNTESSERKDHAIKILALTAVALYALGESQLAIETLHQALRMAEPEGYMRTFVDAGQPMAALLYQTLAQEIMPHYGRRLLAVFPDDDALSSSSPTSALKGMPIEDKLIVPLSERELEVLQLMAGGASNQDIAEALIIAVTTAKKHVSNIIRKLGVDNRMQAVAKGRNLGLCE